MPEEKDGARTGAAMKAAGGTEPALRRQRQASQPEGSGA